ncbi:MAG TPA: hypothetical protein VFC19_46080 [Candidatus Limnocylindrales bacterium]|nr:hypothetical protein [Candidatus Limnocylindrales bacterium]
MTDIGVSTIDDLLRLLHQRQGDFAGEGLNHEGEQFNGRLRLSSVAEGAGILLTFDARSLDGQVCFHTEHSLIARDDSGTLVLWHLGSNLGFLTPHRLSAVEPGQRYAFRYGDPAGQGFAEEISLTFEEARIGYWFAWGRPGSPFGPRSSVLMSPAEPPEIR